MASPLLGVLGTLLAGLQPAAQPSCTGQLREVTSPWEEPLPVYEELGGSPKSSCANYNDEWV